MTSTTTQPPPSPWPLRDVVEQASHGSPPKVSFIIGDARLRRRRHRVLAGVGAAAAAVAAAVAIPLIGGARPTDPVLAPVTTAPSCPDESRTTAVPEAATEPGARGRLVPGHPSVATVCWYRRVAAPRVLVLSRGSEVQGSALLTLVARLNTAPAGFPAGVTVSCPADSLGGEPFVRAFFAYPGDRFVTVHAYLTGCRTASNGAFVTIPDADSFAAAANG